MRRVLAVVGGLLGLWFLVASLASLYLRTGHGAPPPEPTTALLLGTLLLALAVWLWCAPTQSAADD